MDRSVFQQLSGIRIEEAKVLLDASNPSGAYYLAGYSVEFALKSCILNHVQNSDGVGIIFKDKKYVNDCYTHDLVKLLRLADLEARFDSISLTQDSHDRELSANWLVVKDWNEHCRYRQHEIEEAEKLITAIDQKPNGVLLWLKQYW